MTTVRLATFFAVFGTIVFLASSSAQSQTRSPKRVDSDDEPAVAYRSPEEFSPSRWGEFQKQAEQLWTKYPDHPYAARAMFDWCLVAKSRQDPPADIHRVQIALLFQHPASIYARHVVAGTKPEELRQHLSALFEQQPELDEQFLTRFGRLVLQGFSVYGPSWIAIDEFGIQCLLSARVAKLGGLTGLLESKFEAAPDETKTMLEAGLDEAVPAVDRYVRLSEFGKDKSARLIQRVLWTQLSSDEQQQPRVQAALAERLLWEGRWDLVLPIAEQLRKREPNNARWLLWSGCCLVSAGRDAEGKRSLKQVVELEADSEFGALAKRLLPVIDTLSHSEADSATVLDEATNRLIKSDPDALLLEASFLAKDGQPIRLQYQFDGPHFRAVCWKGKQPRAGFQNSADRCRFFTKEESAILELAGNQYQPTITFQLNETSGGLGFGFNANLGLTPPELKSVLRLFLESPALANGGFQTLMRRRRAVGVFALPVEVSNGNRTLKWLTADLLKAKVVEFRCVLTKEGDFKELHWEETLIRVVQCGKLGEIALPKLDWPDFPLRRIGTEDINGAMRLLSLMSEMMTFDEPSLPRPAPP